VRASAATRLRTTPQPARQQAHRAPRAAKLGSPFSFGCMPKAEARVLRRRCRASNCAPRVAGSRSASRCGWRNYPPVILSSAATAGSGVQGRAVCRLTILVVAAQSPDAFFTAAHKISEEICRPEAVSTLFVIAPARPNSLTSDCCRNGATKMGRLVHPITNMKNNQANSNTPSEKSETYVLMDNGLRFYWWVIGIAPSSQAASNGENSASEH